MLGGCSVLPPRRPQDSLLGGLRVFVVDRLLEIRGTAALRRQVDLDADGLSQIQPVSSPVGRSASILVPSDLALRPVALDESKPTSSSTIGAFLDALQREIDELRAP